MKPDPASGRGGKRVGQKMLMPAVAAAPRLNSYRFGWVEPEEENKPEMNKGDGRWGETGQKERRAVESTLALWRDAAGRGDVPRLSDIQIRYDGDGWEHRFLLIEDPNPHYSVFILCGASVREGLGGAVVGRSLEEVVPPDGQGLIDACVASLRERTPVRAAGEFSLRPGSRTLYRAFFLPVRGAPRAPRYVLGTFGWRCEALANGRGC